MHYIKIAKSRPDKELTYENKIFLTTNTKVITNLLLV